MDFCQIDDSPPSPRQEFVAFDPAAQIEDFPSSQDDVAQNLPKPDEEADIARIASDDSSHEDMFADAATPPPPMLHNDVQVEQWPDLDRTFVTHQSPARFPPIETLELESDIVPGIEEDPRFKDTRPLWMGRERRIGAGPSLAAAGGLQPESIWPDEPKLECRKNAVCAADRRRKEVRGGLAETARLATSKYKADNLLKAKARESEQRQPGSRSLYLQVQNAKDEFGQTVLLCKEVIGSRRYFIVVNDRCFRNCSADWFPSGRRVSIHQPFQRLECGNKFKHPIIVCPPFIELCDDD